MESQLT